MFVSNGILGLNIVTQPQQHSVSRVKVSTTPWTITMSMGIDGLVMFVHVIYCEP